MSSRCPVCGQGDVVRDTWQEEFEHRGDILSYEHVEAYCNSCGSLLQTPEIIRENMRRKQEAKNSYSSILVGDEILSFRESFYLSQKTAAELFGGGPTAFPKYEANQISHNRSMDNLIRLCMKEPMNILELAKIAKIKLSQKTINEIYARSQKLAFSAAIKEAAESLKSSNAWTPKVSDPANDSVFERFSPSMPSKNSRRSSDWAIELEAAAA